MPPDGRLAAEFPPLAVADTKNITGLTLFATRVPPVLRPLLATTKRNRLAMCRPITTLRRRAGRELALQRVLPGEIPVLSDAQINTFE